MADGQKGDSKPGSANRSGSKLESPGESPFAEVSLRDSLSVLQNAVSSRAKVHLWTEGRAHQMVGRISKVAASSQEVILVAVTKDQTFENALENNQIEDVFVSVQMPSDLVYFKAKVKRSDEVAFSFKVELPIYKVQRRQAIRVPVPSDMASAVKIIIPGRDKPLIASVINISVGGIGILTKEMDFEPLFQVGMNAELSFQFGTLPVNTPITLRYLQKVQSTLIGKRLRIGVQFEGIPQKSQDEIHIYVMNESVKFLGRKP